jgi:hypothetical protein
MHHVTVVSPFRDCGAAVPSYVQRVLNLDYSPDALRFVAVEGDSVDDTTERLQTWFLQDERVSLVECDTGKPRYGSVVHPERFRVLAQVLNAGLDAVDLEWSDFVLVLPSDILFAPDLVRRLVAHDVDLVSPLTWTGGPYGLRFYDLWALSQHDRFFGPFAYVEKERLFGTELTEMTTIGGTLLMGVDVLRAGIRYTPEQVDRGLCYAARAAGFRCWLDPMADVEHP